MIAEPPPSTIRLGVGFDANRRGLPSRDAWKKAIGTKSIPARLELLPEPKSRWDRMGVSASVQLAADRTRYGSTSRPAPTPSKDQAEGSAAGAGGCRAGEVESEAATHFLAADGAAAFDQEGRREGAGIESRS